MKTQPQSGLAAFEAALLLPEVGANGGDDDAPGGPGSYDAVVAALRGLAGDDALGDLLVTAWGDSDAFPRDHTGPLRLLASLRAAALTRRDDHPLATELLLDAVAPELEPRLRTALSDPALVGWLRHGPIRLVDPARAAAWGLASLVLGLPHRGFDLVERHAGAGLALVVDRTAIAFRMGTHSVQGFDFPSPERRDGFDAAPIPLTGEDGDRHVRWLLACVWPGERDRLARLKATLTHRQHPWAGASPPAAVHATTRARWPELLGEVEALAGGPTMRPRLLLDLSTLADAPPDPADLPVEALTIGPPTLWLRHTRTGRPGARALRLEASLVRDGALVTLPLAEVGFHGTNLTLDLSGPARLRELWAR
jgi:hypothetical protein